MQWRLGALQGNTTVSFPGSDYALSCVLITTDERGKTD